MYETDLPVVCFMILRNQILHFLNKILICILF